MKPLRWSSSLRNALFMLGSGAAVLQFSGCDPAVRDSVFTGVQGATVGLVTAFVNALFLAIAPEDEAAVTTQAVIDMVQSLIC